MMFARRPSCISCLSNEKQKVVYICCAMMKKGHAYLAIHNSWLPLNEMKTRSRYKHFHDNCERASLMRSRCMKKRRELRTESRRRRWSDDFWCYAEAWRVVHEVLIIDIFKFRLSEKEAEYVNCQNFQCKSDFNVPLKSLWRQVMEGTKAFRIESRYSYRKWVMLVIACKRD